MPHHWKPLSPGNPNCQTVVQELLRDKGDKLKYVGYDARENLCWALYETGQEEEDEQAERHPCERLNLKDEYIKD
jgi:hypothetical protein